MSLATARMVQMANAIRALSMDAVQAANSGHPGMPMGMADVATVLWSDYLKHDPAAPDWADRDRFVLSAGHGSMLIYSLLHPSGYAAPTMEDIRNLRQLGSPCAGHPENFLLDGFPRTLAQAKGAYEFCLITATKVRWFNEYMTKCEQELFKLDPRKYPRAAELRGSEIYTHQVHADPTMVELGRADEDEVEEN